MKINDNWFDPNDPVDVREALSEITGYTIIELGRGLAFASQCRKEQGRVVLVWCQHNLGWTFAEGTSRHLAHAIAPRTDSMWPINCARSAFLEGVINKHGQKLESLHRRVLQVVVPTLVLALADCFTPNEVQGPKDLRSMVNRQTPHDKEFASAFFFNLGAWLSDKTADDVKLIKHGQVRTRIEAGILSVDPD